MSSNYLIEVTSTEQKFQLFGREGVWRQTGKKWVPSGCCMTIQEIQEVNTGEISTSPSESWIILINEDQPVGKKKHKSKKAR